ncbi:hypothetical protein TNCV_5059441, partial [Trichonephila clavipes]
METWRNLGGKAKLASILVTLLTTRRSCWRPFLASSGPYGFFRKLVEKSTNIRIYVASGSVLRIHQRKFRRILWRENMDEPIKTFELSTVTYGTTSAPFLARHTLLEAKELKKSTDQYLRQR